MAKCTTNQQIVAYTLRLSAAEAQALRDVCSMIGGDPQKSRRGLMDNIGVALSDAGLKRWNTDDVEGKFGRGIYFKDETDNDN